jgi:hypothetical protein
MKNKGAKNPNLSNLVQKTLLEIRREYFISFEIYPSFIIY